MVEKLKHTIVCLMLEWQGSNAADMHLNLPLHLN